MSGRMFLAEGLARARSGGRKSCICSRRSLAELEVREGQRNVISSEGKGKRKGEVCI